MYRQPEPTEPREEPSNRRLMIAVLIVGAVAVACAFAALAGGLLLLRMRPPSASPTPPLATDTPVPKVQIALEPDSGPAGTYVMVRGSGWVAGEVVLVFLLSPTGDVNQSLTVAVAIADETGAIEKSFSIPKGDPWDRVSEMVVLARSNRTGNEARATFRNVSPTATPLPSQTPMPTPTATPGIPTPTPTVATATPTRTPVIVTDWLGEYWANQSLQGEPVLQRNDASVDFGWGTGSPADNVPADRFSARWTRELTFDEGAYIFHVAVDDGARLWVDQRLIIDEWHDSGIREYTAPLYLTSGRHFIKMEYYDAIDNAVARLWWTPLVSFAGWEAAYYENASLSGAPVIVRDEPEIRFDWGGGAPPGLNTADNFSVRWTRMLNLEAGRYRFAAMADDGVRVWVNDRLIINGWQDSPRVLHYAEVELPGGLASIRVEYYERTGGAAIEAGWERLPGPSPTPSAVPPEPILLPTFTPTPQP